MTPAPATERIERLDALRGLALLGILLANVPFFSAALSDVTSRLVSDAAGLTRWLDRFAAVFIDGKFWTLFALLFGMGFAVMDERARQRGADFVPIHLRRSLGLLAIGAVHALLIWSGDILVTYALAALALPLLRHAPVPWLWRIGVVSYLLVIALLMLGVWAMAASGTDLSDPQSLALERAWRDAEVAAFSTGTYAQATAVRWRFLLERVLPGLWMMMPMAFGLFAIGAWLVRSGVMLRPDAHRRWFRACVRIAGPIGLAVTWGAMRLADAAAGDSESWQEACAELLHLIGAPLMTLAYLGLIVQALERGNRWLRGLAPAGRMALTIYLTQSLVGTWFFYGYGLGLWGEVPRAAQWLGAAVLFALQWRFSVVWLSRFRYGPAEWLWRAFTYGTWPAFRLPRS